MNYVKVLSLTLLLSSSYQLFGADAGNINQNSNPDGKVPSSTWGSIASAGLSSARERLSSADSTLWTHKGKTGAVVAAASAVGAYASNPELREAVNTKVSEAYESTVDAVSTGYEFAKEGYEYAKESVTKKQAVAVATGTAAVVGTGIAYKTGALSKLAQAVSESSISEHGKAYFDMTKHYVSHLSKQAADKTVEFGSGIKGKTVSAATTLYEKASKNPVPTGAIVLGIAGLAAAGKLAYDYLTQDVKVEFDAFMKSLSIDQKRILIKSFGKSIDFVNVITCDELIKSLTEEQADILTKITNMLQNQSN